MAKGQKGQMHKLIFSPFLVRFPFVAVELKHFPGTIAMDRFAGQLWWCSMDTQVKIGGDEEELEEDIFDKEEEGDGDEDDEVGFDDDDNNDDGDDGFAGQLWWCSLDTQVKI